jgi:hypothetical protein
MIRILRVLEYVYDTAEVAADDMGLWTQQSPPNWANGRMRMRSAALPFETLRFDGDIEVPDFGRVDTPVVPGSSEQKAPMLGLATTREMIQELHARMKTVPTHSRSVSVFQHECDMALRSLQPHVLDYRTVDH